MSEIAKNPLIKHNKLKRFSSFVHQKLRERVEIELIKTDVLKDDIYTKSDMWERLDAIANCATLLEVRVYEDNETRIHNGNFCHNPSVCPICSDRISKRRRAIYSDPIKKAVERYAVDKYSKKWKDYFPKHYTGVYLATATIKDSKNLKERIFLLNESIKKMRKMGQKRDEKNSLGEWRKIKAGISNMELKVGKNSGEWHTHVHFLIFTNDVIDTRINEQSKEIEYEGKKIKLSKFSYEWYIATNGQGLNFDVRPLEYKKEVHGTKCETFADSIVAQAQEVLKYNTLLTNKKGLGILGPAQYVELIQRRGTHRLFNTIGDFRADKRNPCSLVSIEERELKRLEYVDKIDNKKYKIFSSLWNNGECYSGLKIEDRSLFRDSDDKNSVWVDFRRKIFSAQTAKYQGEYRKERNHILRTRHLWKDGIKLEEHLDKLKNNFRSKVSAMWNKFKDSDFLPEYLENATDQKLIDIKNYYLRSMLPF